ncbi:MAG: hypothetical protein K1000chlam3_00766 [Chlamydiae bacterium]|nr:hypothetical protein [Chlamydiota bacterium]
MFLNRIFLFFAIYHFSFLHSDVTDHLKKIDGKTDAHRIRNIDFIYMINLDQRPEKFERSINQLHPYGIYPYRFSAVNGWELSLEEINDVGVKYTPDMDSNIMGSFFLFDGNFKRHDEFIQKYGRTYFCHCMSRGSIGIVLSHLSILKDAYDSGYETIWVMEDDIDVVRDPTIIPDLIDQCDALFGHDGWDILFTDRDTKDRNGNYIPCIGYAKRPNFTPINAQQYFYEESINANFRRIGARYGAYSMILRRSGIEKILNFLLVNQVFLPYDMEFYLPHGIILYTVQNDVVSTDRHSGSDNGKPNYLSKKKNPIKPSQ